MAWSICCCELHVVAYKSTIVKHGLKLSIEVEAQPVPQKTTFSHKNHAESVRRVKHRQQEGTEHNKGNCHRTKKGESSRLPKNELLTGTLGHRHQPQYQPYRIRAETREGRYWERSTRARCGKLSCPPASEVLEERRNEKNR